MLIGDVVVAARISPTHPILILNIPYVVPYWCYLSSLTANPMVASHINDVMVNLLKTALLLLKVIAFHQILFSVNFSLDKVVFYPKKFQKTAAYNYKVSKHFST